MRGGHKQFWLVFADQVISHPAIRLLGWAYFVRPVLGAVLPHHHNNHYEFHFLLKGRMDMMVGGELQTINPYEAILTGPFEVHGGMNSSLQKGQFFWMQLDAEQLSPIQIEMLEQIKVARQFRVTTGVFQLVERIVAEQISPHSYSRELEEGVLMELLVLLLRESRAEPSESSELFQAASRRILENISDPPTQAVLAKELNVTREKLQSVFKLETGATLGAWLINQRFSRAITLLKQGNSASEVSRTLGFSSPQNFMTTFRNEFGFSPSNYAKLVGTADLSTFTSVRICDFPQSDEYPPQSLACINGTGSAQILTGIPPRTLKPFE